jgi:phage FluMu protein Com
MSMMDLKVTLDFACCTCGQPMSVTVTCSGKGLALETRTVASVHVPCPTCSSINQLYFEPSGRIHAVTPFRGSRPVPEPSVN